MSPWQLESVLDVPRNLSLKFHQNWVSNSWDIPDIEFLWGGGWGVQSHFQVKPNLVLRLGWGFDNKGECILSIVVVLCDPYYDIITEQCSNPVARIIYWIYDWGQVDYLGDIVYLQFRDLRKQWKSQKVEKVHNNPGLSWAKLISNCNWKFVLFHLRFLHWTS